MKRRRDEVVGQPARQSPLENRRREDGAQKREKLKDVDVGAVLKCGGPLEGQTGDDAGDQVGDEELDGDAKDGGNPALGQGESPTAGGEAQEHLSAAADD